MLRPADAGPGRRARTMGMAGAELANILNEAAAVAARATGQVTRSPRGTWKRPARR
jgi:ATP-dependent Zn protease